MVQWNSDGEWWTCRCECACEFGTEYLIALNFSRRVKIEGRGWGARSPTGEVPPIPGAAVGAAWSPKGEGAPRQAVPRPGMWSGSTSAGRAARGTTFRPLAPPHSPSIKKFRLHLNTPLFHDGQVLLKSHHRSQTVIVKYLRTTFSEPD